MRRKFRKWMIAPLVVILATLGGAGYNIYNAVTAGATACTNSLTGHWTGSYDTPDPGGSIVTDFTNPTWEGTAATGAGTYQFPQDQSETAFDWSGLMSCTSWSGQADVGTSFPVTFTGTFTTPTHLDAQWSAGPDNGGTFHLDKYVDPNVDVNVGSVSVPEGDPGASTTVSDPLTLSQPSDQDVTVDYTVTTTQAAAFRAQVQGASLTSDTTADRQEISLVPGKTYHVTFKRGSNGLTGVQKNINFKVWGNSIVQPDLSFQIVITGVHGSSATPDQNLNIGTGNATNTIVNDDTTTTTTTTP